MLIVFVCAMGGVDVYAMSVNDWWQMCVMSVVTSFDGCDGCYGQE